MVCKLPSVGLWGQEGVQSGGFLSVQLVLHVYRLLTMTFKFQLLPSAI